MSVDGYIARSDGGLDWLTMVAAPGEDYGYAEFVNSVDTVLMGRKTYEKVLTFDTEFPHKGRQCYVLTQTRSGTDENVTFYNGSLDTLINELKSRDGKDIFVDGGAEVVNALMKQDLIDRFIISIIPTFLGSGIALFRVGRPGQRIRLTDTKYFPSGLVQLCYERVTNEKKLPETGTADDI